MNWPAVLTRITDRPDAVVIRAVLDIYGRSAGGMLANGLSFFALFAAIPTTLLVLGLTGWVAAGDPAIRGQVSESLVAAFPPLADIIRGSVDAVAAGAGLTSLVGTIGLLWTAGQLFGALDLAFARIFSAEPARGAITRQVRGFVIVGLLLTAVVAVVTGLGLIAALDAASGAAGSMARGTIGLLGSPPFLAVAASAIVAIGYRILPSQPPRWRALRLPALVVGVTLVALSNAFAFLVPWLVNVAELAGTLTSAFAALAWLSLSFQTLLVGAAWVRVRDEGRSGAGAALPPPASQTPWEVPQRRQNRAVEESDSPQLTHG